MLPEDKKEFVKRRVKSVCKRYWKKDFKTMVPSPEKRLEIYKEAWTLRENRFNNHAIPTAKLQQLLVLKLGHWNKKQKGMKIPKKL